MSNENILTPNNDVVFKRLFGQIGNERLIKDLLEAILDIQIESVELGKEVELTPEKIEDKIGVLDVRVHISDGTIVDVEMQNYNKNNIEKRMTFYVSRLYTEGIKESEQYNVLKKTIGIAILNFDYFKDIEDYHTKWKMTEQKHKNKTLEEQEIHFIELPKFMKTEKNVDRKLDQWLLFLENNEKGLIEMAKEKNEVIKEAAEKYEYLTGDEEVQRLAFLKMKYELDRNSMMADAREEGLEEGRKEGLEEARKETAKKMLEMGLEIEIIEKATELTKEEIIAIKENEKA